MTTITISNRTCTCTAFQVQWLVGRTVSSSVSRTVGQTCISMHYTKYWSSLRLVPIIRVSINTARSLNSATIISSLTLYCTTSIITQVSKPTCTIILKLGQLATLANLQVQSLEKCRLPTTFACSCCMYF